MLDLPRKSLDKIKRLLLRQQRQVEEEIKSLDKEDPLMVEAVAESSEPGTDSFQADVHARLVALKGSLLGLSKRIQHSLIRLKNGTYGKCEGCGKAIESARLEAMPAATLCLSCSKKSSR